jgi:hypothetical protein
MTSDLTITQRVETATERLSSITRHAEEQVRDLQENQNFDGPRVKHALEDDLHQIETSVLVLSKVCLHALYRTGKQISSFETSIEQAEGSLIAIRADAGRQLIPSPCIPNSKTSTIPFQPHARYLDIGLPPYGFQINTAVLKGVGRPNSDPSIPLVYAVQKGDPVPNFWSRYSDFFVPTGKPPAVFETSFSAAYGFDGSQCLAATRSEPIVRPELKESSSGRVTQEERRARFQSVRGFTATTPDLGEAQQKGKGGKRIDASKSEEMPKIEGGSPKQMRRTMTEVGPKITAPPPSPREPPSPRDPPSDAKPESASVGSGESGDATPGSEERGTSD